MKYCNRDNVEFGVLDLRDNNLEEQKVLFTASVDDVVVGVVELDFKSPEFPWLNNLFVENKYRQMGIAKQLIHNSISWLTTRTVVPRPIGICSGLSSTNPISRKLHESLGFRHVYTWPKVDTLLYSKLLSTE